ncbi:MAG: FHA domain-containing protein [Candidatus Aminicenantia bacterium]
MIVKCPNCRAFYRIEEEQLDMKKRLKFKCPRCLTIFEVSQASNEEKSDELEETRKSKVESEPPYEGKFKLPSDKKYSLAVINGPDEGAIFHITKPYITIGRENTDIILMDMEVSRKHACIEFYENRIVIRDLGSTNGTYIDNKRIMERELSEQTEIRMGRTTLLFISTPFELPL